MLAEAEAAVESLPPTIDEDSVWLEECLLDADNHMQRSACMGMA